MPFPLKPPAAWFEIPEASKPTPLTYERSGKVYGHLALWDSCHTGFMNGDFSECVRAPKSANEYQSYHLGVLETAEGRDVRVGKITYGTGHAPLQANMQAAAQHYDHTGSVGAFVRARNGNLGIWLSGAVRSDIAPEGFRDLRANPPSGDWRALNRNLELIASLSVPVPGFPIPRVELALAASADGAAVSALIMGGLTSEDLEEALVASSSPAYVRERKMLAERMGMTAAVLSREKRRSLPKGSFAIPETRSYPIHDRAHAANALSRSSGKPEAGRVKRAVCRKYPDMPACRS